jgi:hypothetical protein
LRLSGVRANGDYIASALKTEGGHLSIGRGGFTLHFGNGLRLSGYDCDHIKLCCIEAGLPVIDSRMADFDDVVRLSVNGPMAAVGGHLYLTVMRARLAGFIDMGCVSADARIVEINGPIGRMRRELRLWLLGRAPDVF